MAKTVNRVPISVPTPSSSAVRDYFFTHSNWKGLTNDKNFLTVDQETFSDCKNVYIDSDGLLKSRPALHVNIITPNGHELGYVLQVWDFDNVNVYHSLRNDKYYLTFVNGDVVSQVTTVENIKLVMVELKIFVFSSSSLHYYDVNDNEYLSGDSYIYRPESEVYVNNVLQETVGEAENELTDSKVIKHIYEYAEDLDFSKFYGKTINVFVDGESYDVTFTKGTEQLFVSKYSNLNGFSSTRVLVSENGVTCKYNIDEVYYSVDGIIYKRVEVGRPFKPFLTEDGLAVMLMKNDGVYKFHTSGSDEGIITKALSTTLSNDNILNSSWSGSFKDEDDYVITYSLTKSASGNSITGLHAYHDLKYIIVINGSVIKNDFIFGYDKYIAGAKALVNNVITTYDNWTTVEEQAGYKYTFQNKTKLPLYAKGTTDIIAYLNVNAFCFVEKPTSGTVITPDGSRPAYAQFDYSIYDSSNRLLFTFKGSGVNFRIVKDSDSTAKFYNDVFRLNIRYNFANNTIYSAIIEYNNDLDLKDIYFSTIGRTPVVAFNLDGSGTWTYSVAFDTYKPDSGENGLWDYHVRWWSTNSSNTNNIALQLLRNYDKSKPIDCNVFSITAEYPSKMLSCGIDKIDDVSKLFLYVSYSRGYRQCSLNESFNYVGGILSKNGDSILTENNIITAMYYDGGNPTVSKKLPLIVTSIQPLYYDGNRMYFVKDDTIFVNTFTQLTFSEIIQGNNNYILPSSISELSTFYFAKDKSLWISKYPNDGNFKWYFPKNNTEELDYDITNLHPISEQEMAVFTKNNVYYIRSSTGEDYITRYYYNKSKMQVGCKSGSSIITSYDGKYTIFASSRGLVAMTYQDFVASTEQILTFLSDAIHDTFKEFNSSTIKLCKHNLWIYCYKENHDKVLLLDLRNNSWWPLEFPYNIKSITEVDGELVFIANGKTYKYNSNIQNTFNVSVYYDYDGTNKSEIDWKIKSQKLHLNAINNYKHVSNITLASVIDGAPTEPLDLNLSVTNYRKIKNTAQTDNFTFKVDTIRMYMKRLNYVKVNEFQYELTSNEEKILRIPLSLSCITIKYKISGQVR